MTLAWIGAILISATPDGGPSPPAGPPRSYQEALASAGRSPEAQVRLALWCEARGLTAERLHHLTLAILADPANATARGLLGLVARDGRWLRPEAVAEKSRAKVDPILAEYDDRRLKAAYTADDQWALGVWCDEHGLKDQARAHLSAVTRLDPSREVAWKRLGCRKHDGRWATDAQLLAEKAEAEAQKAADRRWKPILEKLKADIGRPEGARRDEAERASLGVTDPRAVPSILRIFGTDREVDQSRAVRLLGQVDSPSASRALAGFALAGRSADVRRAAAETLKGRDPRESAGALIALMRDPIRYRIQPVGGPGQAGVLLVEGERYDVQRRYTPPPFPQFRPFMMGDVHATDADGLPIIIRTRLSGPMGTPAGTLNGYFGPDGSYAFVGDMARGLNHPQPPPSVYGQIARDPAHAARIVAAHPSQGAGNNGDALALRLWGGAMDPAFISGDPSRSKVVAVGRAMVETQNAALAAERQLEQDAAAIDRYNEQVVAVNRQVADLLNAVAGKSLPADRAAWRRWFVDQAGYALLAATPPRQTIVQDVPLNDELPPVSGFQNQGGYLRISCFGAGTPVRTVDGPRPIESLAVGDLVLTQSTATGALGYRPILVVHRNPPSPTFRIRLGGESIVSSHFHRFWVAGRGWAMARELKPGDPVRTLGGVASVESVEADPVQPVFNLDVADDADFFVGRLGALVHDNTLPDPRLAPFDAPPPTGPGAAAIKGPRAD